MIRALHIKNYTIIDEVSLELSDGFNVITGETGAGKSVLVGALSLVLGERSSLEGIRQGSEEAIIEAAFDPPSSFPDLNPEDEDLDLIILRRVFSQNGKNRAYLNGSMATLGMLKRVGRALIEVHGQQGQHHLTQLGYERSLLDNFGSLSNELEAYQRIYQKWARLKEEATLLEKQQSESSHQSELLSFQLSEIRDAKLDADEETVLEGEERRLKQWESIVSTTQIAQAQLSNEGEFLNQLDALGHAVSDLNRMTEDADEEMGLWEASQISLKELASRLRMRLQDEEYFPERLEEVASRLFLIHQLKRKYQRTVSELLAYQQELETLLSGASENKVRLEEIKIALKAFEEDLRLAAKKLSEARKKQSLKLQEKVQLELRGLGMEKTRFQVVLHPSLPTIFGIDQVEFLIALQGEIPRGLAKIASGGELSRIMLALKVVLAEVDPVPTFLFDEVDAGVGGGIAERVGRRLFALSANHQVLCITHLPQIASLADHHYFVEKKSLDDRIVTTIRELSETERVEELARMLGGVEITALTRRHAKEMISAK